MKDIKVEYIVLLETKNSFCNSKKSFNKLLETYDDIKFEKTDLIKFKRLNISYEVQTGVLKEKGKRFFHMKFITQGDETINKFSDFLKVVRDILIKVSNKQPVSLWDDVSFYYANKSYPLIHDVENLMRKLLTKFAMTKFDSNWTENNVPDEVRTSIKGKFNEDSSITVKTKQIINEANYLYQTDFIQLINFLSGKIKTADISDLLSVIETADTIEDLNLNELKSFVPTNNWDKYFSKIVDFEWSFLEKRWKKLYQLRCKVAHNNFLIKRDYEEICKLIDDIKPKLIKAIKELDKVVIYEEDQEELAETFASNANEGFRNFITLWNKFEKELYVLTLTIDPTRSKSIHSYNSYEMISMLKEQKIISFEDQLRLEVVRRFRNKLVHEVDFKIEDENITKQLGVLVRVLKLMKEFKKEKY